MCALPQLDSSESCLAGSASQSSGRRLANIHTEASLRAGSGARRDDEEEEAARSCGSASPSNDPQVVVVVVGVDLAILFNFLTVANRTSCLLPNSRDHPKRSYRGQPIYLERATSSERITSTSPPATTTTTTTDSPSKGSLFELLPLLAELSAMENEISNQKLEARGARQVFSAQH